MEYIKLSDICDVRDGTHDSPKYVEEGFPLVTSKNIVDGELDLSVVNYICQEDYDKINTRSKVDAGDIIMPMIGTIGNPYVVKEFCDFAIKNVALIKFPNEDVNNKFVWYFLISPAFSRYIAEKNKGGTQKFLSLGDIRSILIPKITIDEQKEIVKKLDTVYSIIESRKKEITMLDELIKARFVEMFGNIHEDRFPKCKLRDVAHIKHGYAFSGEYFSDDDNGVVLVTPGNFALGGGFQEVRNRYFTSDYPDEYVLHAGDLIVTMTDLSKKVDTLGYGAIVPNSDKVYLHNQRIGLFDKLDSMLNPVFVRWFMQTDEYRLEIVRTSTGSTVHHTSPDRILDTVIYLPPIEMQNKFVSFAEQVDKSKVVVQKSLEENQLLFDSLMQKYFG